MLSNLSTCNIYHIFIIIPVPIKKEEKEMVERKRNMANKDIVCGKFYNEHCRKYNYFQIV